MNVRPYTKLTDAEEAEMVRLLRRGIPASQVVTMTGRSIGLVSRVRDDHGIEPQGRWPMSNPAPSPIPDPDPPESEGVGLASPWIPPPGYDMYAERRLQGQWLAMCAAASGVELVNLRHAVCKVLGLPPGASDLQLEAAVVADRRLAEDLAGRYLAARARLR